MAPLPEDLPQGLRDQAAALAAGSVSSVRLVSEALRRAERAAVDLGPFRVLRSQAALEEAAEADRRLDGGEAAPLLGVPVAVKDDMDLAGETTPFGCAGEFPLKRADSEAVRRLRAAGAVVVGKTHTPELGLYPWTEGPAFAPVRNPWNTGFTPGGSSGGSAVAVAAGVVAGALGSDGAGSVRIPASWTNLVGIKPQRGRVSTWPDPESFQGITGIGPLARTVGDAALLLDCLTGNAAGDRWRPDPPSGTFAEAAGRPPRRLRIGLALRPPWVLVAAGPDPGVVARVRDVAERLARLGHRVEETKVRYGPMGVVFVPRASAGIQEWYARVPDPSLLDPRTRAADVLLTPTTAGPPLPIGAAAGLGMWATERLMTATCPYAWPWNLLGWPAISVPAGFVGPQLPVGAQLAGPAGSEETLISLAAELEDVTGWAARRPAWCEVAEG